MLGPKSKMLFEKAINIIPGGVNSPVRACRSVGMNPLFIEKADGPFIYDVDGRSYIDYVGSWGPMILGHRHPAVIESIIKVLETGTSFGAPTELEVELAELVVKAVPSIEVVRMVNSGTEAAMSAIRLARGVTGRDLIIKFDGCYHGHADTLLVEAGSGVATFGIPGSPGVPKKIAEYTLSLPFNDIETITKVMEEQGKDVAAVIVEPVAGNMGLVKPVEGFLETLRTLTTKNNSLLIFDEVMTGFRVAFEGAQGLYNVIPDITCLGKIIGGGLPVGAYGGKAEIMAHVAPVGNVYQAGTLSGNPLAMASGIATLKEIAQPNFYATLEKNAASLESGLKKAIEELQVNANVDRCGSMLGLFFNPEPVTNFAQAKTCDLNMFTTYYQNMLQSGIYLAPSQFEAFFLSSAHETSHIEETVTKAKLVLKNKSGKN